MNEFSIGQEVRIRADADFSEVMRPQLFNSLRDRRVVGVISNHDPQSRSELPYLVEFEGEKRWFAASELEALTTGEPSKEESSNDD